MPVKLKGATSGDITLDVPAVAGTNTLTLPALTGNIITSADTGTVIPAMLSTGAPTWSSSGNSTIAGTLVMGSSFLRNRIINGGMDIWQRGTSSTSTGYVSADRWISANTSSVSRSTDAPSGFQYSMEYASSTGTFPTAIQRIESVNCVGLAGQVVTVSFWAKNISGASTVFAQVDYANAVDNFSTTTFVSSVASGASPSSAWTFYSGQMTLPAAAANGVQVQVARSNTAAATTRITGIQIELGTAATPFERRSYGQELMLCQRYYVKSYAPATVPGTNLGAGNGGCFFTNTASTTTICGGPLPFGMTMRAVPTFTIWDNVGNLGKVSVFYSSAWTNNLTPSNAITITSTSYAFVNYLGSVQNMSFDYVASAEL